MNFKKLSIYPEHTEVVTSDRAVPLKTQFMKIEKTESGYFLTVQISPSDYLQLRDHFAKEIVEGLTDEMISMDAEETYPLTDEIASGINLDMRNYRIAYRNGAKRLRSQITGSKKGE